MSQFQNYISPASIAAATSVSVSGAVLSGGLGAGVVFSGNIASGQVGPTHVASGGILSGNIASGQIGSFHIANAGVLSGDMGSGQVSTYHHSSGAICPFSQYVVPVFSGAPFGAIITGEVISGVRAVSVSQSGFLQVAMAAVSGRMPAVGIVADNVLSGIAVNVYTQGIVQFTSGLFTGIGFFGQPVWVGRSGHLCPVSGSFCSGGFASGDIGQKMGVAIALSSGAILVNVNTTVWSGGPLGEATGGVL
jgi:hypothetical protein